MLRGALRAGAPQESGRAPRARHYHQPHAHRARIPRQPRFRAHRRAIRFIDANYRAQPRLAAIAASAHLSEFHFNRLFRRWAGVTPRQYLAYVTARAARAALASTPSVLEAATVSACPDPRGCTT